MVAVRSLFSYICVVFCACSLLLVAGEISFATNSIAYHGRIIKPNGSAFEPSSATLVLQIRSTGTEDCLMWEETFSNVDMTGTAGVFSLNLNSGTGSRTDGSGLTFAQVFGNYPTTTMTVPLANCAGGSNTITLTANSHRIARLRFKDSVMPSFEQTPDMAIAYVPFSMDSQKVGGFTPQNLLRVEDATGPQAAAAFSPADFLELQALIGGSSGQYEKAGELNGQAIPALSNNNVLAWNGGGWTAVTPVTTETDPNTRSFAKADLPTCNPGEFLSSTGANTWVCAGVSGAAGGTVTSITVGSGLVDGSNNTGTNILTTGTIALPDVVTAGTGTKVTYDVKGRITASTTLAETDLPNITTAGKVSGDAITSGTIAGSTAMNTSGNITAATGSLRTLVLRDADTNTVTVQTPADVTANYVLTLPPNDGGAGEVLTTDGSGVLSWTSMSGGSGATSVAASDGTAAAPSVSFSSDPDTGWFRPAADTLAAATAGAERVRINSAGNVGIGTTSPAQNLHVASPSTNATVYVQSGSAATNPQVMLGNSSGDGYSLFAGNNTNGNFYLASITGGTWTANLMSVTSSGNVGIGTTSPWFQLTNSVQTNVTDSTPHGLAGTKTFVWETLAAETNVGYTAAILNSRNAASSHGLLVKTTDATSGSRILTANSNGADRLVVRGDGNVGVGTTAPGYNLDIRAAANTLLHIMGNTSGVRGGMSADAPVVGAFYAGSYANFPFVLGVNNAEKMRIDTSGNVGVGTTNPGTKLQVAGVISPSADNTYDLGTSALRFKDIYAANNVIQTSDARLKTDVQDSDLGLGFINNLRPVSYYWKDGDPKLHYGVIAQETEKALSDAKKLSGRESEVDNVIVTHDEKTDRYGVRYTELIAPIIKAIQELYSKLMGHDDHLATLDRSIASKADKTETEALKIENEKLKQENAAQAKQLEAMKAYLCAKDPNAAICK